MPLEGEGKRILDFGCTRSELVLQFASFGYEVWGIDLRDYFFTHPNLTTLRENFLIFLG
jgi:2-polyprenyl-3-methyl-5-hydroxy-6-metoxy-1,4-benzoquinol methylase